MNPDALIRRVIEYCFYCLFIIVPLILTPYNYELFEFNKMLTVYFFAIVIGAAWICRMVVNRRLIFVRTPFDIPLLLFLFSQVISTVISIDPHTSLWGYYSRFHGGLLSTIAYLTLYYAYAANMAGKTKNVITVVLTTAALVSLYGVLERLGIDKKLWVQDVQNRIFSTIGQPNWLAAYLLTLIPLFLAQKSRLLKLMVLLPLSAIWFTRSRSGLMAAALVIVIYFFLLAVRKYSLKLLLVPLILLLALGIFRRQYLAEFFNPTAIRQDIATENLTRKAGSSSILIRRVVWSGALEIFKAYPVFGSGVETFAYSYYNYRPVTHNLLSEWDYLYNKAHNEFLNMLSTTGAIGLITYSSIIIWFSVWGLKNIAGNPLAAPLLAGYWGLGVSNFLGFSVVPVGLFFFLFPAISFADSAGRPALPKSKQYFFIDNYQAITITLVAIAALFLIVKLGNLWLADKQFNYGRNYVALNQVEVGYQFLIDAVNRVPNEPLFRNDLAEAQAKLAVLYNAANQATISGQLAESAVAESDKVMAQNNVNLNFYKSRIKIFLLLDTINHQYANAALETTIEAIKLAPTDAKLRYNLGLIYNQIGQTGLAEQTLKETIDLKPDYEAARFSLGSLYQQLKQNDLAKVQYQYILDQINPDNQPVKDKLNELN